MIKISKIYYSYGAKPCLENISLDLEDGKIYGLLGENGVGKTTLLTLLCGLKPVQSGAIKVDGSVPYKREPVFLASQFYLPDEVAAFEAKAITFAHDKGIFWPEYSEETFLEIMKIFEMDPQQKMNQMSAGQLKKTWISFALACRTKYLYLDEPTNGLDIPSKAQFRKAMMSYTREDSVIVISTHQVKDLENLIDPIIILDNQDVLLNASVEEITSKLYFDYGTTLNPDSLYSEQVPGGFIQVYPNTTGEESKVNVEALFNTVHKHKELIKGIFSHE
ncbi:MAG: ATP-binding cassette domain-containing protein [Bacteroidales bacterium]|nr:ATP-binding cassette domain-containing protein [Bacteroidales bacterium]